MSEYNASVDTATHVLFRSVATLPQARLMQEE